MLPQGIRQLRPKSTLVILSLVLDLVALPTLAANWSLVGRTQEGESYYINPESVKRDGPIAWFWTKTVEASGYSLEYWSVDCNARSLRIRESYRYTTKGTLTSSSTRGDDAPLQRVIPDSKGEELFTEVCNSTKYQSASQEQSSTQASQEPPRRNRYTWDFPLESCGDKSSSNGSWWPVFINNGNLNTLRNKYCGDAISVYRENIGVPAVQLASFSSYEKAAAFSVIVGGEVGELTLR